MCFRRLDVYTDVPLTSEMIDLIVQIMAQVLIILGIATKEVKQDRLSKFFPYKCDIIDRKILATFSNTLIGRTEMEDALKKLDQLTQEEAQMSAAQNLKATHTVDEGVKVVRYAVEDINDKVASVDDQVARIDDRVAGVDDRVAGVDARVAGVDDQVARVDARVAGVDDRVAGVDARVVAVDNQVARVNERVVTVDDRVKLVDNNLIQVVARG
jgi:archaellum component FlaC